MKRLSILLILLLIINCSTFGMETYSGAKLTNVEVKEDIEKCETMEGREKAKCHSYLGEEYIRTYNAPAELESVQTILDAGVYQINRYKVRKHKIEIEVDVKEVQPKSWLDIIKDRSLWVVIGVLIGAL